MSTSSTTASTEGITGGYDAGSVSAWEEEGATAQGGEGEREEEDGVSPRLRCDGVSVSPLTRAPRVCARAGERGLRKRSGGQGATGGRPGRCVHTDSSGMRGEEASRGAVPTDARRPRLREADLLADRGRSCETGRHTHTHTHTLSHLRKSHAANGAEGRTHRFISSDQLIKGHSVADETLQGGHAHQRARRLAWMESAHTSHTLPPRAAEDTHT